MGCGYIKKGVATLSQDVVILKSEFSVHLCQFSKTRPKKTIDKELDNLALASEIHALIFFQIPVHASKK